MDHKFDYTLKLVIDDHIDRINSVGESLKTLEKKVFLEAFPKLGEQDQVILEEVEKQRIDTKVKLELQSGNLTQMQSELEKLAFMIKQLKDEAETKKNESIMYS